MNLLRSARLLILACVIGASLPWPALAQFSETGADKVALPHAFLIGVDGPAEAASALYQRARDAYDAGDLRQAATLIEAAIAAAPDVGAFHRLQAYIAGHRKDNALSLRAADAALALDDEDAQAWSLRGTAHYFLGDRDTALADYQRALDLDYRDSAFYRNYLHTLNEVRRYDTMLSVYDTYLQRQSDDPEQLPAEGDIPFYASLAHYADKDYPGTIALLTQAIALAPDFAGYYHNRAAAYDDTKQYTLALADYASAIRLAPKDPDPYYNRGVTWLNLDNPARALEDFSTARKLGLDSTQLWLNIGASQERLDHDRQALQAYDRALRVDPGNAQALGNRASLLRNRGKTRAADRDQAKALATLPDENAAVLRYNDAQALTRENDWAGAIALFEEAVRLKPDFEEAWVNLAAAHARLGRRQEALDLFNDVLARYPRSAKTLINRGKVYKDLGDPAAARQDYLQALKLEPTNADVMARLAQNYATVGDRRNALAYFERARRAGPESPDVYINYSATLLDAEDERQALVIATEGARRFPDSYALLVNLANAQAADKAWKDAIRTYRKAIDLMPSGLSAYYNLANLYAVDLQQPADGIPWYQRALRQPPDPDLDAKAQREQHTSIQLNLASAQRLAGDGPAALATLQAAIDETPDDYRLYFNRAGFLLEDRDEAGARRDFAAALERLQRLQAADPAHAGDDPELLEYLGYALFHLGRPDEAVGHLERVLQQHPEHASVRRNLGFVLLDLDRPAQAQLQFEQAFTREPDEIDGWLGMLACTSLTGDKAAKKRLQVQFAKRFSGRYALEPGLPERLVSEGYWYSDRFRTLWKRLMAPP